MAANDFFNALNNQSITTPATASGLTTPNLNTVKKGVSATALNQTPLTAPPAQSMTSSAGSFISSLKGIAGSVFPALGQLVDSVSGNLGDKKALGQPGQPGQYTDSLNSYDQLYSATKTPEQTQLEKTVQQDVTAVQGLNDQLGGQSNFYQNQLDQAGATDALKQLKDNNLLIASKTAEFDNRVNDTLSNPQGRAVLTADANRQADYINRQKAIEIGALAAKSQALQGNYQLATEIASKATELQFEPIQQQITNKLNFINTNRQFLSDAEKKQADKMTYVLNQQEKAIEEQKVNRQFAIENDIQKPFYLVGSTITRTSDGKSYATEKEFFADGGSKDFSNAQRISFAANAEKDMVVKMANTYLDAGVNLTDSISTAREKIIKNSKIYADQVRPPVRSGGGGTTVSSGGGVPKGVKVDAKGKIIPATQVEKTNLNFYLRAKDANDTIATVEDDISELGLTGQTRLMIAPNWLQTQEAQIYNQASRQFTEARLRKESGAAIPESEIENDRKTYFAVPGDTAETLTRKQAARQNLLASLKYQTGNAYHEYYGDTGENADPLGVDPMANSQAAANDPLGIGTPPPPQDIRTKEDLLKFLGSSIQVVN